MAASAQSPQQTGMRMFFADPHSPWQRGSNQNANGLLRQYFPKGRSLARFDQAGLGLVATGLNDRPGKTLGFATPAEQFQELLVNVASFNPPSPGGVRPQT